MDQIVCPPANSVSLGKYLKTIFCRPPVLNFLWMPEVQLPTTCPCNSNTCALWAIRPIVPLQCTWNIQIRQWYKQKKIETCNFGIDVPNFLNSFFSQSKDNCGQLWVTIIWHSLQAHVFFLDEICYLPTCFTHIGD